MGARAADAHLLNASDKLGIVVLQSRSLSHLRVLGAGRRVYVALSDGLVCDSGRQPSAWAAIPIRYISYATRGTPPFKTRVS